jgi:hypothetical protein
MIISRLTGGLGNQMFQYAIARSLSIRNKCNFKIDTTEFDLYTHHNGYQLNCFEKKFPIASISEISNYKNTYSIYSRIMNKFNIRIGQHYKEVLFYRLDPEIYNLTDNFYLDGYWQNQKYFIDIAKILSEDFTFTSNISSENLVHLDRIFSTNSVSIHIRRGDYISNAAFSKVHNVLELDYYKKAISLVESKISNPFYFIFSDDPKWAFDNFNYLPNKILINNNSGINSYEDMRLMKHCKHNIIANSSFSWWGAWLNIYDLKIVVAPKKWLKVSNIDTSDLIPAAWTQI